MSNDMAQDRRTVRVNVDAEIGRRVHTLMWDRRITQKALGERLGVGQSGLGRRLRGERGWSASELRGVSETLGVSVGFLFGEPDGPSVGPAGIEPTTSTVQSGHLAPITALFGARAS